MRTYARDMRLTTSSRTSDLPFPPATVWPAVVAGGPRAWHVEAAPLVFRGLLDRAVGGEGRRRPADDAPPLRVGDRPGLWVVERTVWDGVRGELLLRAVVRAPGVVTLRVVVEPAPAGDAARVTTSVRLVPHGVLGAAYLTVDLPARETVVELVHRRLVRDIRAAAGASST